MNRLLSGWACFCRSVFKDPEYANAMHINGVPDVYLPVREGCRLTLYNDAHQVGHLLFFMPTDVSAQKAGTTQMHSACNTEVTLSKWMGNITVVMGCTALSRYT